MRERFADVADVQTTLLRERTGMVDTPMPLTAHLAEFRTAPVLVCCCRWLLAFLICYAGLRTKLLRLLQSPWTPIGQPLKVPLQIIAPAEAFITYLKVGLIAGLVSRLASYSVSTLEIRRPRVARTREEIYRALSRWLGGAVLRGGVLFYLLLPFVIAFLLSFARKTLRPNLSVGYYVTFCIRLMIACGLVFQIPMVVVFLTQLGLLSSRTLIKYFRYAMVLMFIVTAVLTPPDPIVPNFYGVTHAAALRGEYSRGQIRRKTSYGVGQKTEENRRL